MTKTSGAAEQDKLSPPLAAIAEREHISKRIQETKRRIIVAVLIGLTAPAIPIALFLNEARWFEWLFSYHPVAAGAGVVCSLIGLGVPFWSAIRIGFDIKALKRYRHYQEDYEAFIEQPTHCPITARSQIFTERHDTS